MDVQEASRSSLCYRNLTMTILIKPLIEDLRLNSNTLRVVLCEGDATAVKTPPPEGCIRKAGEMTERHAGDQRLLWIGLGKRMNGESVRVAGAKAVEVAQAHKLTQLTIEGIETWNEETMQALTEGLLLGGYRFDRYKGKGHKTQSSVAEVTVLMPKVSPDLEHAVERGRIFAGAVRTARDLVNTPANHLTPLDLKEAAERIAHSHKDRLTLTVLDEAAMRKEGMGGILGVSQGSEHPPFFLHLTYRPVNEARRRVAIIGKSVTFDSGGLSIKPADSMMTMKCDMAGGAATLALAEALVALRAEDEVHLILPACENTISGKALRPGDVITMRNSKTVEVLNTDAEGRLTLADALSYTSDVVKPDVMVDLATLTGACVVALGEEIAGIMTYDHALQKALCKAAQVASEALWPLPLPAAYKSCLKSDVADLKNIGGGKWGGALTAGLFVAEFAPKSGWAHLDIAGPAFAEKPLNAYTPKGGTGYGVRTLLTWLKT